MSKKVDLQADVQNVLKSLPQAEAELEAFLAREIVDSHGKGADLEAIARFGQTAAISTMVSWKKVMRMVAELLEAAEVATGVSGVTPLSVDDIHKLGGLVNNSLKTLAALKLREEVEQETKSILRDKDSVVSRLAGELDRRRQLKDMNADRVERKKLGVTQEGLKERSK